MQLSHQELSNIAEAIREDASALVESTGEYTDEEMKAMIRSRTGRIIVSERTLQVIDDYLTGERV